jgi:hypothetical protein
VMMQRPEILIFRTNKMEKCFPIFTAYYFSYLRFTPKRGGSKADCCLNSFVSLADSLGPEKVKG